MIRRIGPHLSRQPETTGGFQPEEEKAQKTPYFAFQPLKELIKKSRERLFTGACSDRTRFKSSKAK